MFCYFKEVFEVMASEDPAISKKLKDWIKTTNVRHFSIWVYL